MNFKTITIKKAYLILTLIFIVTGCMFQKPGYLTMITAPELKQAMEHDDIFLVDVHTPEQKHIKGTDVFIAYNEVEKHLDKLPADKNTAIYLYCESGPMANAAARSFYKAGFQNLINLEGGAQAWRKHGFAFE